MSVCNSRIYILRQPNDVFPYLFRIFLNKLKLPLRQTTVKLADPKNKRLFVV